MSDETSHQPLSALSRDLHADQEIRPVLLALVHSSISKREVELPPVAEQTAIAIVLSDMDAEIAALEARRAKTTNLKQAIMQELLTGRTRLM